MTKNEKRLTVFLGLVAITIGALVSANYLSSKGCAVPSLLLYFQTGAIGIFALIFTFTMLFAIGFTVFTVMESMKESRLLKKENPEMYQDRKDSQRESDIQMLKYVGLTLVGGVIVSCGLGWFIWILTC